MDILKRIYPLVLLTFVNAIGFSIMLPILPEIILEYKQNYIMYGFVLSIYSIFQFFGSPILGSLSDKFGRKPILVITQIGTLACWLLFIGASFLSKNILILPFVSLPLFVMIIARAIDGITGANNSVANAYVADKIEGEERSKAYGFIGAAFGLGYMLGPIIGAYSASFAIGYLGTLILASVISAITLITILFLPESLEKKQSNEKLKGALSHVFDFILSVKNYRHEKTILRILGIKFIFSVVFLAYSTIIILFLEGFLHLSKIEVALVFAFSTICFALFQSVIIPKLNKWIGMKITLRLGQISLVSGLVFLPLTENDDIIFLLIMGTLIAFGIAIDMTNLKAMLVNEAQDNKKGEITGIEEGLMALNASYIPIIFTYIYSNIYQYSFILMALIASVALFIRVGNYNKLVNN